MESLALLSLLQITNSALPIGAYSYSDGLEFLCDSDKITSAEALYQWLLQELNYGVIRLEAVILWRIYHANSSQDLTQVIYWNNYLSATRETEEMRLSSWQMGQSLAKLIVELDALPAMDYPVKQAPINTTKNYFLDEIFAKLPTPKDNLAGLGCNFATSYAIAASYWHIPAQAMLLGYLMSWATNAVNAGIKLIPLGQTIGQQLLRELHPSIAKAATLVPHLTNDDLENCGFGLTLASMQHQVQYSRLFRS